MRKKSIGHMSGSSIVIHDHCSVMPLWWHGSYTTWYVRLGIAFIFRTSLNVVYLEKSRPTTICSRHMILFLLMKSLSSSSCCQRTLGFKEARWLLTWPGKQPKRGNEKWWCPCHTPPLRGHISWQWQEGMHVVLHVLDPSRMKQLSLSFASFKNNGK